MDIVVVGGGNIGYHLARSLLSEGHEVLVIEKDAQKCERISEDLGSITLRGDGCEVATLETAGAGRADMLVAVTGDDEDNLVSCQVARHRFQVKRTVARVANPKLVPIFQRLGVDCVVSSTMLIMEHIEHDIPTHSLVHLLTIADAQMEIVEVRIPPKSAAVGRKVKDLSLPSGTTLSLLIRRQQRPQIPTPETVLQAGDQVVAVTLPELEEALKLALTETAG